MKIKLDVPVIGFEGKPLMETIEEGGKKIQQELTMRKGIRFALQYGRTKDVDRNTDDKRLALLYEIMDKKKKVLEVHKDQLQDLFDLIHSVWLLRETYASIKRQIEGAKV